MILVLNCGSQSIKWKLFDLPRRQAGDKLKLVKENKREVFDSKNFSAQGGPASGWENILHDEMAKLGQDINLIGHRVVHGGGIFTEPLKIDDNNLLELEKLNYLAPLHNPYNVLGIKACQKIFSDVENVAVFDTEFFKDLPEVAHTYALPRGLNFRRFGFHGISHEFVAKKINKSKIITVHLGGGASITAIKDGKAVDTSMGFTPMEGLVMMTRSGNVDAGIVLELCKKFGAEKAEEILNKESGVKGICGEEKFLEVLNKLKSGDERAKLAFDIFVYSIQKYIGAYFAILGGCDALVFTGSIGSGDPKTREAICRDLNILKPGLFKSGAKILAIQTDEELAIAEKINGL
jgi:acetate kinase